MKDDNQDDLHLYNINRLQTDIYLRKMVDTMIKKGIEVKPQDSLFIISLKNKSSNVEMYLDEISSQLISSIGGHSNLYLPSGGLDQSYPNKYFIEEGKGEEIKLIIDEYYLYLNSIGYNQKTIASNGSESVIYMRHMENKNKTFSELNFSKKNILQCLLVLDYLKKQILLEELNVMMFVQCK